MTIMLFCFVLTGAMSLLIIYLSIISKVLLSLIQAKNLEKSENIYVFQRFLFLFGTKILVLQMALAGLDSVTISLVGKMIIDEELFNIGFDESPTEFQYAPIFTEFCFVVFCFSNHSSWAIVKTIVEFGQASSSYRVCFFKYELDLLE